QSSRPEKTTSAPKEHTDESTSKYTTNTGRHDETNSPRMTTATPEEYTDKFTWYHTKPAVPREQSSRSEKTTSALKEDTDESTSKYTSTAGPNEEANRPELTTLAPKEYTEESTSMYTTAAGAREETDQSLVRRVNSSGCGQIENNTLLSNTTKPDKNDGDKYSLGCILLGERCRQYSQRQSGQSGPIVFSPIFVLAMDKASQSLNVDRLVLSPESTSFVQPNMPSLTDLLRPPSQSRNHLASSAGDSQ
ncbi:hypothetical protein ANCCAN_00097, partial [Ancylostoma caninum]